MENPQRGLLIDRYFMKGRPYVDVDDCMFTDWGYQKPTRLWGSPAIGTLSHRSYNKECGNIIWETAPDGHTWIGRHRRRVRCTADPGETKPSQKEAGRVPPAVIHYLLTCQPGLLPAPEDQRGGPIRKTLRKHAAAPLQWSPRPQPPVCSRPPQPRRSPRSLMEAPRWLPSRKHPVPFCLRRGGDF